MGGRFCGTDGTASGQICCLPCPLEDWVYSDKYVKDVKISSWISVASFVLCAFLLMSFVALPSEANIRHFLNIGLTVAITLYTLAFMIPLGTKPNLCYDKVTPHGQDSDMSCAWTGAFLLLGGIGSTFWILLRSLWLNIRICWDKKPGRKFTIFSVVTGIAVPAAFTAATIAVSGVSYRIGTVCIPNHEHSIAVFWSWTVAFGALALISQAATTLYCVWIYVRVLLRGRNKNTTGTGGSGPFSHERPRPQHTWHKVRRVLLLQWRGIALALLVTTQVLFYIIVFWAQDLKFGKITANQSNLGEAKIWTACLAIYRGDKTKCLQYSKDLTISQDLALASLMLGALCGIENFFLLVRRSMFIAWWRILTYPWRALHGRRGSDAQLTSLELPPNPDNNNNNNNEKDGNGNDNDQPPKPGSPFSMAMRDASRSTIPINNPYKLSLPSERASMIDAAAVARHRRDSPRATAADANDSAVTLTDTPTPPPPGAAVYSHEPEPPSTTYIAYSRPETPPPPPLPLQPRRRQTSPTFSRQPGGGGGGGGSASYNALPPSLQIRRRRSSGSAPVAASSSAAAAVGVARSASLPGVANAHRLPSWARSENGMGSGGSLTATERDAMRGGLALNPVGAGGSAGQQQSESAWSSEDVEGEERRGSNVVGMQEFLRESHDHDSFSPPATAQPPWPAPPCRARDIRQEQSSSM